MRRVWRAVRHPIASLDIWWGEAGRNPRLDRNPIYICVLIGVALPSLAVVLVGPVPNSALTALTNETQIALCACIFFGSCALLYSVVRTDRKKAYRRGYTVAPLVIAGLAVYGITIVTNTANYIAALSGTLTPLLAIGLGIQAVRLWLETRRIARVEKLLMDKMIEEE